MAQLKAARVADVPTLDVVAPGLVVAEADAGAAIAAARGPGGRFSVVGHRGKGMNALASGDRRLQEVRENTVRSFNDAARFPVDYVEFDVQQRNSITGAGDRRLRAAAPGLFAGAVAAAVGWFWLAWLLLDGDGRSADAGARHRLGQLKREGQRRGRAWREAENDSLCSDSES
ncbi:hypothetical protein C2845_PM11G05760 [Panicum miliaceum]|uniref:glycerophosphodiester phosphodiesterase n=1 Tax=Panicum miliaceum TaxID=4540 RepID=A0A3L6RTR6_PANMI|nr:hypothetical protein C2845_PM11G05760 [Panicum miliaceum]